MSIFSQMAKIWKDRKVGVDDSSGSSETGVRGGGYISGHGGEKSSMDEFFDSMFGISSRRELYRIYRDIEEGTPEVASGLDIYADYAVSGGTDKGTSSLVLTSKGRVFNKRLRRIDQNLRLSSKAWRIVRCMCEYGDAFYELIVNGAGVQTLKVLPRGEMFRIEDEKGALKAFMQHSSFDSDPISFQPWQVSHFRLVYDDEEKYGRSILWPSKREALELMLMRSGMTITRLSRAHRRLKHMVDVGDASSNTEIERHIAAAKARNKRQRTIDPRSGRMSLRANPLRAEEDIYIPVRKDSKSDVDVLAGDDSLRTIDDILFKRAGVLAGMKMPESWLGLTGPNVRNVADHQVLNFLKTVRRVRRDFASVAIVPYQIALMLQGIPWERVFLGNIDIAFPKMSMTEDMLAAELDKVRTIVAERLIKLRLMSRFDILVSLFEVPEEEARRLIDGVEEDSGAPDLSRTRNVATPNESRSTVSESEKDQILNVILEAARGDRDLSEYLDNIRFLLEELRTSAEFQGLS